MKIAIATQRLPQILQENDPKGIDPQILQGNDPKGIDGPTAGVERGGIRGHRHMTINRHHNVDGTLVIHPSKSWKTK